MGADHGALNTCAAGRGTTDECATDHFATDQRVTDQRAVAALVATIDAGLRAHATPERRAAAAALLEARSALLVPEDLALLERFLRESRIWALVDDIAALIVGPLVERARAA